MINNEQDNPTDAVATKSNPSMSSISIDESQNQIEKENNDEFIRVTAAHQMLIEAQTYDEQKNYPLALRLYRVCVDFLLEELMFAEGTDQSRIYLREKCTAIMDRIDLLKTKLEPIPSSIATDQSVPNLPIDQLESLNLS